MQLFGPKIRLDNRNLELEAEAAVVVEVVAGLTICFTPSSFSGHQNANRDTGTETCLNLFMPEC